MLLDERLVEAFLGVAKHGSIGRAAEALNISQPTLSRMIKRLEQHLDVPLFDRFAAGVTLTVYGEALLPFAERIDIEGARARDELNRLRSGAAGALRIGSAPSFGIAFLPAVFARLTAENPALRIEMLEGVAQVLEPALLNRKVDVVISSDLIENEDVQRLDLSFRDTGGVIAGTDHPARAKGTLKMADLAGYPWVLPPTDSEPRRAFQRILSQLGVKPPHVAVETWSVSMMKALVTDSGFISWVPRPLYAVEEKAGLIAALDVPDMIVDRRTFIFRRRLGLVPPAVVRFLEVARALRA
jgi:DNA-binding transcriptional LysR family regulator